jgi:hypothetical protein
MFLSVGNTLVPTLLYKAQLFWAGCNDAMVKPVPKIQNAIWPISRGPILGDFFSGVVCDPIDALAHHPEMIAN